MKGLSPDGIVKAISFALSQRSSVFQIHQLHGMKYCCTSFPELMSSNVGKIYWCFFTFSVCLVPSWWEHVCYFLLKVSETQHFSEPGKHHAPFFSDILPHHSFTLHPFWRLVSSRSLRRHWNTDHSQLFECDRHHLFLVQAISNFIVCGPNLRRLFLLNHIRRS